MVPGPTQTLGEAGSNRSATSPEPAGATPAATAAAPLAVTTTSYVWAVHFNRALLGLNLQDCVLQVCSHACTSRHSPGLARTVCCRSVVMHA